MNPSPLVDTAQLESRLGDPDWIVVDCRHDLANPGSGRAAYEESHIPGARFLHLDDDLSGPKNGTNGRHPLPDAGILSGTLARAGIGPSSRVIAYDAQGGMCASRLWWLMRWIGHDRASVLDGGWKAWVAEGRPVTAELPVIRPGRIEPAIQPVAVPAAGILAGLGHLHLLDARTAERYRGINETMDPVGGRIPGAMNRFFMSNLGPDGRFKPAAVLRDEFTALLGTVPPHALVHYCGSGVSACHNLFAMEIAGLSGGRLYPGSWSEWCADPARPVGRGEPAPGEVTRLK